MGKRGFYHVLFDKVYPKTRFFFEKRKKIIKSAKTQKTLKYAKISDTPFDQLSGARK